MASKLKSIAKHYPFPPESYLNEMRCPLCHSKITTSSYLQEVFSVDIKTLWIANRVTHYRHNHITSWNNCWGRYGGRYRKNWFGDYDEEKHIVNERAKRQLIRKGHEILTANGVQVEHFKKLAYNDEKTLDLVCKYLSDN